ncbi:MAG: methionine adenosyltransferase [Candidatus Komeilibacteria bacterium RIFOXYC1_FULL_37_11]|uniref:Methionine adenosyltransferase n=1 Tax=Candidatus Komeilibacteria bacterium RIFOXYC1_FULL_37_11 TaxID=1798555 RepID=A0A1G2BZX2_9BACT|nr:MAG: methionine adenosyltransferase [Candidatus Komeilibacteria bacterium RIFOXYC1_FULL_37_11]OGY95443.1 MAG: methionine adenosyltransferase [Candidatus Komeilibacteria bacterium RIFOXYD1_FULL_37_29]
MLKTAEQVAYGHPDKVCDQISDAILDECLRQDPSSRVAVEALGGHGKLVIMGEVTTTAHFDAAQIARDVYKNIGYQEKLEISVNIVKQSPDIARGVDTGGAGDQGIMVGYATSQTPEMLPLEHVLATKLVRKLEEIRNEAKSELSKYLMPDAKAQVTLNDENGVEAVVLSTQHKKEVDFEHLKKLLEEEVIKPIIPKYKNVFINPAGPFVQGGFEADTGLTGRKITADNYGPQIPVGGGCFSGKDSTKVDRSAAYMARYLAVEYLRKYQAKEVLVKLAYAIGYPQPVMATAQVDGQSIKIEGYDLSPRGIINKLNLRKPQYQERARYGFFRDFEVSE